MWADLFQLRENMTGCIYQILNIRNGKKYIGQTTQPSIRKNAHFSKLRHDCHPNEYLQNSFNKNGERAFLFEIIESEIPLNQLDLIEEKYINKYDSTNPSKGYNLRSGGKQGRLTLEGKRKISEKLTGHEVSKETKQKMSKIHKGKQISKEHRKANSKGLFGFQGTNYAHRRKSPWTRTWVCRISFKGKTTHLGVFNEPLSAHIVYNLVLDELFPVDNGGESYDI